MASKNKGKALSSPSQRVDKRRRIERTKMPLYTGTRSNARQAFSDVNGGQEQHPTSAPPSNSAPNCGVTEFTKEDAEALLNEKLRIKNNFNYKEKTEKLVDHNRRLKQCIRWYQQREVNSVTEQDKLKSVLESAEKKCSDMESMMKAKEDELSAVIMELRKNLEALQENFAKEQVDKLDALDTLTKEKDSRLAAERLQVSLSEDLKRAQQDNASANQKIQSLNDMYKRLQEYNTSLQQYNSRLQSELHATNDALKRVEQEKASVVVNLSTLRGHHTSLQDQLASSRVSQDELTNQKETLVKEVACLRGDLQLIRDDRDRQLFQVQTLSAEIAKYKVSQDELTNQKETLVKEVACLRGDLQLIKDDRDRQLFQVQTLSAEIAKYKECTEKSSTELDKLIIETKTLESTCISQSEQIRRLQEQLDSAERKLQMSDLSAIETRSAFEEKSALILHLKNSLADSESKIAELEKLRKKLHNTILELKGNIRVFCRVRPLLSDDGVGTDGQLVSFPNSMDSLGRGGIELNHNGQKHSFTFDKVFVPDNTQEDVFVEISQLVQSALDGYKVVYSLRTPKSLVLQIGREGTRISSAKVVVCIFAYGQTGSGKTHTMMGKPGISDQKGLIPRSLEQVFETKKILETQGWKYEMQVSMLEIYNETIRDLLATNKSMFDPSRVENSGKQYAIKHDANGNTHVHDLTCMDVRSSKEVSYLLDRAANSRSVSKTQMNEQSSRSHFVFTLKIVGVNESTDQQVQGVLNLIDLAGSERLSKSGSTGDRLKETQAINKSLSALSDVIFSIAKKEEHVPFRNSRLTYLLQPCLGGDSKTLMFVNVSPDPSSVGESLCSLRFAARVNACEIGVPRRQTNVKSLDSRLSVG